MSTGMNCTLYRLTKWSSLPLIGKYFHLKIAEGYAPCLPQVKRPFIVYSEGKKYTQTSQVMGIFNEQEQGKIRFITLHNVYEVEVLSDADV